MNVLSYQYFCCPKCATPGIIRVYQDFTVHFECSEKTCGYGFNTFGDLRSGESVNND